MRAGCRPATSRRCFADGAGQSLLSRTAVSEITARLWAEYEGFAGRDLAEFEVVHLFVDGIAERLHLGQPREALLATWGILAAARRRSCTWRRAPRKTPRAAGNSSTTCAGAACPIRCWWSATVRPSDPCDRGVFPARAAAALPGAQDAQSGKQSLPSRKRGCPKTSGPSSRPAARPCYQAASPALARPLRDDLKATYGRDLPSAVACLEDDFEACIAHLRFPLGHRRAIRTTNLLERLFGEERRRTKVIPHAFGERAVLKLMYAALIPAAERWRGNPHQRVRAAPAQGNPRGDRQRLRRTQCTGGHCAPISFIQQSTDLTSIREAATFELEEPKVL